MARYVHTARESGKNLLLLGRIGPNLRENFYTPATGLMRLKLGKDDHRAQDLCCSPTPI